MTVGNRDRVQRIGDEIALVDEFAELTWGQVDARTNQLLTALRGLGLRTGDVIGLLGGNRHEWTETLSAGLHTSAVVVPINWHFSVDEIAYVLENSGASVLVADAEYAEQAAAAAEQAGVGVRVAFGGSIDGFADYEDLLASASADEPEDQGAGHGHVVHVGHDRTTEGREVEPDRGGRRPGGRAGAGRDVRRPAAGCPRRAARCSATRRVYHAGPLVFCLFPASLGSRLIMRRNWDAEETLQLIDRYEVTTGYAVPTHFTRLLRLPDETTVAFDGSSLRSVYHTAAPCPPEIKRQMIDWWGPVINELYGASESGGAGTICTSEQWLAKPGTVGRADCRRPSCSSSTTTASGSVPTRSARSTCRNLLGADFEYLGDEEKTDAATSNRACSRSATSATSTRTATCSCRTARST